MHLFAVLALLRRKLRLCVCGGGGVMLDWSVILIDRRCSLHVIKHTAHRHLSDSFMSVCDLLSRGHDWL